MNRYNLVLKVESKFFHFLDDELIFIWFDTFSKPTNIFKFLITKNLAFQKIQSNFQGSITLKYKDWFLSLIWAKP